MTLGRDVILVAEAGEEAATLRGIEHPISENGKHIEAGIYLAEGGSVSLRNGQVRYAMVQTAE